MTKRRKTKQLSEEEVAEIESFINKNNQEEDKFLTRLQVDFKCKTENQKKLVNSIRDNEFTIVSGLPGSGKTFISCAESLKLLKLDNNYKKIILIKSVTPLKDEDLGTLPGNITEKVDPYMQSFLDNLNKLIGRTMTEKFRELGLIEVLPIAYARGRSIDNSIIIIDEAQNITLNNIRTLMTRIGYNSKMIILGDVKQKDLKRRNDSSLEVIIEKFKNLENFGIVELRNPEDIVRNKMIKIIEDIFDEIEESKK